MEDLFKEPFSGQVSGPRNEARVHEPYATFDVIEQIV
jgi:hypothetical protein